MNILRTLAIAVLLLPVSAWADGFDDVVGALKNSSPEQVSKYLNANVELTLLDNESLCSKAQAEQMLKKFFERYPARNVSIQHRGASGAGAKYAIANYESQSGVKFRVYIFMKDTGKGTLLIHELRIEKE